MSKADKRKIEELRGELRDVWDNITFWQKKAISRVEEIDKLREELAKIQEELAKIQEELRQQKEKYALLLERYISMMERTVGIDEQREADL